MWKTGKVVRILCFLSGRNFKSGKRSVLRALAPLVYKQRFRSEPAPKAAIAVLLKLVKNCSELYLFRKSK